MIRKVQRRGKRVLLIDFWYTNKDGSDERFRHDAQVQTMLAATAEERRYLANVAQYGSPYEPKPEVEESEPIRTFGEVVKEYRASYMLTDLKCTTRRGYDQVLDCRLLPRFRDLPITGVAGQLSQLDLELAKADFAQWTRNHAQTVARSVITFAVSKGYLTEPPRLPKLRHIGASILEIPSDGQAEKIVQLACPAQRVPFALMAYAGLRPNEVRALRWRNVLLRHEGDEPMGGFVTVKEGLSYGETHTPKTGERIIPIARALAKVLGALGTHGKDEHVAVTTKDRPWGQHGLAQAFDRVRDRAGLSGWSIYSLRHYAITSWLRKGVPVHVVQRMAGHTNLATTQRYTHLLKDDLEEAARRLG
jgi:integrase